ncbi:MAG: T9SS type A sorting domain-containing protein [Bacteroidia bacterium]|nr:T9SS type A sorting domain-containing protein [Bacteroidia bacterium]
MKNLKKTCLLLFVVFILQNASATHTLGSYFQYKYLSTSGNNDKYKITLTLYSDCAINIIVPCDTAISVCIYEGSTIYNNVQVLKKSSNYVNAQNPDNCSATPYSCVQMCEYETTVDLKQNTSGYHLTWVRCCRGNIENLQRDISNTPIFGSTLYAFIPGNETKNSNPVFAQTPWAKICFADTAIWVNPAVDPDGDSLSYSIETPMAGGSDVIPAPDCSNTFSQPSSVAYAPGYTTNTLFGADGLSTLDALNGSLTLYSKRTGYFTGTTKVTEWRKGVAISTSNFDYSIAVEFPLGIKNTEISSLKAVPNPSNGLCTVKGLNNEPYSWVLYNSQGSIVRSGNATGVLQLNTADLSLGMYMLRIQEGATARDCKILVGE